MKISDACRCLCLISILIGSAVHAAPDQLVPNILPVSELPDALACLVSAPFSVGQSSVNIKVPEGFAATDCLRWKVPGGIGGTRSLLARGESNMLVVDLANSAPIEGVVTALFWKPHEGGANVREYFVAEDGRPGNAGTEDSPWDFRSALDGSQTVEPGAMVWFKGGTYSDPIGKSDLDKSYEVALVGKVDLPIHVRPLPGEHARIEGGFRVVTPAAHLWIGGFEFQNSDPVPGGEPTPPGSVPNPWPEDFKKWGGAGIAVMSGKNHVIYNNATHGGAHAYSAWNAAPGTVIVGNIAYDAGWIGEDRAHGHCLYVQNSPDTGTKVVRHNLFSIRSRTINGNYGLHFYAERPVVGGFHVWQNAVKGPVTVRSDKSHCERISFLGNVACSVLVGDTAEDDGKGNSFGRFGRPDRGMTMRDNVFIDGVKRLENCGWGDLEVAANRVVKTHAKWWAGDIGTPPAHAVAESGEFVDYSHSGGPDEARFWPNQIDRDRAHLAIMDFDQDGRVKVDVGDFLNTGDCFRIIHYKNFPGSVEWIASEKTVFRGGKIEVEMVEKEDALDMFVLLRHR